MKLLSDVLGYTSIVCWIIVFTPQVWMNYKRKSGDSLSVTFLTIWLLADIFNILGIVIGNLLPTMLYLGVYYAMADIILLYQVFYYRKTVKDDEEVAQESSRSINDIRTNEDEDDKCRGVAIISASLFFSTIVALLFIPKFGAAQFMGWFGSALYIGSRIPQLIKNYQDTTTDGLSVGMFIFSVVGNVTYCLSILTFSNEKDYIIQNLAWIVGSIGTLLLDMIMLVQCHLYSKYTTLP